MFKVKINIMKAMVEKFYPFQPDLYIKEGMNRNGKGRSTKSSKLLFKL